MKSEIEIKKEIERLEKELPKMITDNGTVACEAALTHLRWVLE